MQASDIVKYIITHYIAGCVIIKTIYRLVTDIIRVTRLSLRHVPISYYIDYFITLHMGVCLQLFSIIPVLWY